MRTETEMPTLEELLRDAEAKRSELNTVIRYLRTQLGLGADEPNGSGTAADAAAASGSGGAGGWVVNPGEFYGMSGPKAAYALLKKGDRTRPLKTEEIYNLIVKGGCSKVSTKEVLYRNLFRDAKFHKVGRGVWGLSEWYPASARKASKNASDETESDDPDAEVDDEREADEAE
jgi:hypothetical protein